jgi:hypothetical protein
LTWCAAAYRIADGLDGGHIVHPLGHGVDRGEAGEWHVFISDSAEGLDQPANTPKKFT